MQCVRNCSRVHGRVRACMRHLGCTGGECPSLGESPPRVVSLAGRHRLSLETCVGGCPIFRRRGFSTSPHRAPEKGRPRDHTVSFSHVFRKGSKHKAWDGMARLFRRLGQLSRLSAVPAFGASLVLCDAAPKPQSWPPMASANIAVNALPDDGSTAGVFNYVQSSVKEVWTRRDAGGSDDVLHGAHWNQPTLAVKNGRGRGLTLDLNGFECIPSARSSHVDYYDEQEVTAQYYRQCEELIASKIPNAKRVVAFDHNVRCDTGRSSGRRLAGGNLVQGPAPLVRECRRAAGTPPHLSLIHI